MIVSRKCIFAAGLYSCAKDKRIIAGGQPVRKSKEEKMFNRREVNMLHDPYFRIIREEEQFVEIQSLNTGHCWNIFKNQFERVHKIKLYHKHKQTDSYYHEHSICRNVAEAIKKIKSHDNYMLEQAKERKRKSASTSEQSTRKLKVHKTSGYNYKPTPTILLKGQWLKELGFESGSQVLVKCEGGRLIITQATNEMVEDIK